MSDIEKSSGNIYTDLGIPNPEEMLVKAQLATKIAEIIKTRGLNQTKAAEILGLTQPKLSNLLRGKFRGISEAKMLECLAKLGRDIQIVVSTPRKRQGAGRVKVVFA